MAVIVDPVLLTIVIVTVSGEPEYKHDDDAARLALNLLTASVVEVALAEVTVPPFWAIAVKLIVPLSVNTVL